jgi:hypothetical protein
MANTVAIDHELKILQLTLDSDFDLAASYPQYAGGVMLETVGFLPSAANDILRVCHATAAGIEIMPPIKSVTGGTLEKVFYDDRRYKPYIDYSDCTFGTPANVIIVIKFRD